MAATGAASAREGQWETAAPEALVPELKVEGTSKALPKTHGRPKSGKLWRVAHERASNRIKVPQLRTSFNERMLARQRLEQLKQKQREIEEIARKARREEARRARQRREAKEANERKSAVVQVIKDTRKIKKMTRKQLRNVMKM
jgi:rRNA-processing protein CGR1